MDSPGTSPYLVFQAGANAPGLCRRENGVAVIAPRHSRGALFLADGGMAGNTRPAFIACRVESVPTPQFSRSLLQQSALVAR